MNMEDDDASNVPVETSRSAVDHFRDAVTHAFEDNPFVVFLCGPSLALSNSNAAGRLRSRLKDDLEANGFSVVLGEDDGLERLRKEYRGLADDNELSFITKYAGAVIVVAGSAGSFCELGLFSHACFSKRANTEYKGDVILIANDEYRHDDSYFRNGPAESVDYLGGKLYWADFDVFDTSDVINRLTLMRTVWVNKRLRG